RLSERLLAMNRQGTDCRTGGYRFDNLISHFTNCDDRATTLGNLSGKLTKRKVFASPPGDQYDRAAKGAKCRDGALGRRRDRVVDELHVVDAPNELEAMFHTVETLNH